MEPGKRLGLEYIENFTDCFSSDRDSNTVLGNKKKEPIEEDIR